MKKRQNMIFFEWLKSAPAAEGGGGAIKFSAEILVSRVTWQIVEYIYFLY